MTSSSPSSIDRIISLRNKIRQNVSKVYANKIQCERLCERIDQLIDPLERLEYASSSILRNETRLILDKLLQCIDDCNVYIEKLKSSNEWYEEIYEYKKSEEKFHELNQRLSQLGQDLSLGLNIQQLFNQKQDQEDQREDLKELNKKLDEISQKMLEKQCEQYKFIDKMIDKRFQSFRYSLEQNLLMQQNSYQSQYLHREHQQFLHIPYKDLYIEDKSLGHGGFADVYKAIWLTHHDQVAVKIIRINHLSNVRDDFLREISTMYRIRYENVLTVLGACIEPNFYAIIVEYMPLGSLYDILHKKHEEEISFDWSDRYSLAWQMSKSINYLHSLSPTILHRDIKSMNFLLKYNGSPNQKYLVKVCDFGLAEIRRETFLQSSLFPTSQTVGSFYWKAPELLLPHSRHTKQSDIYSLGIVFWELGTERIPWDEYDDESIILIQVKLGKRPSIPLNIPEEYKQVIQDAWNHDPQQRPSCFQLMERLFQELSQMTILNNQEDIVDLHAQQITADENNSSHSTIDTDSTRTSIQVAEKPNEEQKLINSFRNIIISVLETANEDDQIESESTLKPSISSPSLIDNEQQNETFPTQSEPTLSKSYEDLTSSSNITNNFANQPIIPLYRIEKRRPLHRKYIDN
ncbi:unnamed protein product [Adineta steineri]|uniref:Protein kinase domain-containing protein n=1 Tax=Adineta steineri TaxID=433720 RepID=A0A814GAV7_9BILA|nr:unnamed protein product [Adineta steineri]CAF1162488.1 unnamed protein product [Adineta steineri]